METENPDEGIARRARMHRIHLISFASVGVVLLVVDLLFFDNRWFYWPVMVWGVLFGGHTLYCKSLAVDDAWGEARANKIRDKSYDIGHIHEIETTFKQSQSVEETPPEKQE